jgi:hypothetical protein
MKYGISSKTAWCIGSALADGITRAVIRTHLEIILRFDKWSKPYYRLYAVVNGKQHFLIERGEQDLLKLARFMSFHTGWQLRP